jgi:lysophospholipase L1-like esterase
MLRSISLACVLVLSLTTFASAQEEVRDVNWQSLRASSPWLFLGDSNTYAGGYVAVLDAWLGESTPHVKLLNLGVSSETASGLSEIDHPFKRPCVHERLRKVLTMIRPKVVFVCYGMNDGIYDPPGRERLDAYQTGMLRLASEVRASGARLICLTPPIFESDVVARKGKFGPTANGRYAYFAPYERYDEVLQQQAAWCLSNEMHADAVIDLHTALATEKQTRVAQDANFSFSQDGVHFGGMAHEIVAREILRGLGAPPSLLAHAPSKEAITKANQRMVLLRDAYLSATGKNRPGLAAGNPVWYAERLADKIR